jgi:hypothetical protein
MSELKPGPISEARAQEEQDLFRKQGQRQEQIQGSFATLRMTTFWVVEIKGKY